MRQIQPWLGLGLRCFIGGYFVFAAVPKIIEPLAFATSISHYGLLPVWLVNGYALVVPWMELLVGLFLVVGFRTRLSAAFVHVMLVMFTFAVTYAVIAGLKIDCGCFGASGGEEVSWMKVAKNLGLIAMSTYLWIFPSTALALESNSTDHNA